MLIGIMLVVLSMTMATQYTSTRMTYRFNIVHPSDSDVRFIASDNSSDDGIRILRVSGSNASGSQGLELVIGGNISAGQNKTYTAAFGIVNEEPYEINITHINVTTTDTDYMQIWFHGDRDEQMEADGTSVKVWDKGSMGYGNGSALWILAAGDGEKDTMSADGLTQLDTAWDASANVRYSTEDSNNSASGTSDFVWVQISIDAAAAATTGAYSGNIFIFTRAGT